MSLSVAFVAHAGPGIGLGHARRCLALASAWAADGAALSFLAPGAEAIVERAAPELRAAGAAGVDVSALDWTRDPDAARAWLRAAGLDVVVVDSYAASPAFLASLDAVALRVAAIDDLADRPLPVHAVINGGIAAESLPYDRRGALQLLLGPRYALIDPRFEGAPARTTAPAVASVLIGLGGAPPPTTLEAALAGARDALPGAAVDVVAGPFAARGARPGREGDRIAARAAGVDRDRVSVHAAGADMRRLIAAADVAVTGAGVTLYELAASGTPAVIVEMADNQAPNAAGFARAGAALRAGRAGDSGLRRGIADALARLAGDPALRADLAARARALVDGRGALRAAREIAAMVPATGRTAP